MLCGKIPEVIMKFLVLLFLSAVCFGVLTNGDDQNTAGDRPAICYLPQAPTSGPQCLAYFIRWYYNPSLGQCASFIYGGCRGNDNNFLSQEQCEQTCGGAANNRL